VPYLPDLVSPGNSHPQAPITDWGGLAISLQSGQAVAPVSEIADRYRRRADAFEALIDCTPPERWASPSPCHGWLARDIVAHIVRHSAETLRDNAGVLLASARTELDDPAISFRWVCAAVQEVLDDPNTSTDVALFLDAALSFDLPQHWWDLAKATGQDATMPPEEVEALWKTLSAMPSEWWKWQVDNGHYAPAVRVPDDAPLQDRIVALIGRDPCWTP
jgi:uncharacterized protein (TIGR03086 family)